MRKNSAEFIRLLYLAVQRAMQKCKKKIRSLKDDFSPEKTDPT